MNKLEFIKSHKYLAFMTFNNKWENWAQWFIWSARIEIGYSDKTKDKDILRALKNTWKKATKEGVI